MKKYLSFMFLAVVLLLTGCKHGLVDENGTVKGPEVEVGKAELVGTVENYSELQKLFGFSFSRNAVERTIMPDQGIDVSSVSLYIYGYASNYLENTNDGSLKLPVEKITTLDTTGTYPTFTVLLSKKDWNLTLVAVKSGLTFAAGAEASGALPTEAELADNAVLWGTAYVPLSKRGAKLEANFALSPDGLKTPGSMKTNIKIKNWAADWALDVASNYTGTDPIEGWVILKNLVTGAEIETADSTPVSTKYTFTNSDWSKSGSDYSGKYCDNTPKPILPGTYLIEVYLAKGEDEYCFTDTIIILPGVETAKDFEIDGSRAATAPTAPATPRAAYTEPTYNDPSGYYTMHLTWEDASDDETFFEILMLDLSGETVKTADLVDASGVLTPTAKNYVTEDATTRKAISAVSGKEDKVFVFGKDFYRRWEGGANSTPPTPPTPPTETNNKYRAYGALTMGNERAGIYAKLGTKYGLLIRSVNKAGPSAWVPFTYEGGAAVYATSLGEAYNAGGTITDFATGGEIADLRRIVYDVRGGTWKNGGADSTENKIEYVPLKEANPTTTPVTLWYPAPTVGDTTDILHLGTKADKTYREWVKWVVNPNDPNNEANDYKYDASAAVAADKIADFQYSDYKNLYVYACYDYLVTGTIIQDKHEVQDLKPTYISYNQGTLATGKDLTDMVDADWTAGASGTNGTFTASDASNQTKIEMNASNGNIGKISVTVPGTETWNYTSLKMVIRKGADVVASQTIPVPAAVGTANNFYFDMSKGDMADTDFYDVTISATYGARVYSYVFTLYRKS